MAACIRFEDWLDGIFNYLQWKVQMLAVLNYVSSVVSCSQLCQENKIWNYVSSGVVAPTTDPVALDLHEVKEAKVQRIILDGVKHHLIPHLAEKKTT
jgi:hypothetical protein